MLIQFEVFGPQFSHCFTTEFVGREALSVVEQALLGNVAEKRERDFSTGRMCAQVALAELGVSDTPVLVGSNRQPLWPDGVVGSISHSKGLAGAMVSKSDGMAALGLDIEAIGGVNEDLWDNLFSEKEQFFLTDLGYEQKELFSTLFFSMKEAFYKLQHPITGIFLEFRDVEISYENGRFNFSSSHSFINQMPPLHQIETRWIQFEDQVISLCYLRG